VGRSYFEEKENGMTIFRWPSGWDPFLGLRQVQRELERLFGDSVGAAGRQVGGGSYPPVNVLNGPEELIVQCELAGCRLEDIDLSITGETLVVKGVKNPPQDDSKLHYQRRERGVGEFSRTIILPDRVDADRADARLEAGVLTVRLPKSEAAKPKRIQVK